jgi:phosphoglycolate phosphatase-like HAD superfamily hydrolase
MVARKIAPRGARVAEQAWSDAEVFVFDVEGTLVDAMMPTLRCWRETLEAFGHDLSLAEIHHLAGMDASEMLAKLLPDTTRNERQEMVERQGARFREDYLPHIPPLPCARALLQDLKRSGRRIALATDCAKDQLRHYLDVTGIDGLVDAIGCGDDIRRAKPAPHVVDVALRRVRAGRRQSVLVGDTPFDAQAARKAGVIPVGVLTGHFSEVELSEAGCAAVFRDLRALRAAIIRPVAVDAGNFMPAVQQMASA